MEKATFSNWQLSSSDSEDDQITKGVLLTVKNKCKEGCSPNGKAEIISDKYVSLADRLKRRQVENEGPIVVESDDDLPVFSLPSKPYNQRENREASMDLNKKPKCVSSSSSLDMPKVVASNEKNALQSESKVRKTIQNPSKNNEVKSNLNARLKALKPEECLKYIECEISSKLECLFEHFNLLDNLKKDFVATCILTQGEIPCVRWRRMVSSIIDNESQNEGCGEEKDVLIAVSAVNFIKMINAPIVDTNLEETLSSWIEAIQIRRNDSNIHLVCIGLEKYNKSLKAKKARQDKKGDCELNKKRRKTVIPDVSPYDIETASLQLHINFNITITYVETAEEFVTLVKQMTKSVGEAPYKRMKRQDVQFINEIPSVKINVKTGEGKRQAWKQMIQQFHNVTTVMATAITDRYPSIIALMKAYQECGTDVNKAEMLLSDIPVRRGVGTLQTSRRIGPELSYKIYRQLTSMDPNERLY